MGQAHRPVGDVAAKPDLVPACSFIHQRDEHSCAGFEQLLLFAAGLLRVDIPLPFGRRRFDPPHLERRDDGPGFDLRTGPDRNRRQKDAVRNERSVAAQSSTR